ncbi:glycosyltransferase family 9 protein [Psychroserpens sp. SPM9]|uniref:glycosyltransferase family 9 protein n=1 Tax=Psychroserpens sp. SPM9 TaxID=2975598 RepID=UPI0021A68619|nr:glycosyltransferase family 9 protein [Psychroserpens sp. SPM9]MDG5492361.1 glycosyltransferase family 9 protein [Psychroserpens sp. SPM9]
MKILIIQQKMIGDVLTTSILFQALKAEHPEAKLHYVINSHTYPVVENNPFIDKFLFVTPEIESNKAKFLTFLNQIKKEKYDAVIDVYSKFSSNLMTKFSGAKIKISKKKWYTSHYYTHTFKDAKIPNTNAGLAVENRLQLLQPLCENIPIKLQPKVYLTEAEIKTSKQVLIDSKIDLSKPLFMISVLGSGENKTYPLPHMADLIDVIVGQTEGQILFNYIPNQIHEAQTVYNFTKAETKPHIFFDVFGKSLREFLSITHHCTALIGNEGGAVNMAKALNIPTFTIFSPWILKEAWNMFDNDTTNVSIHLIDVKPELYEGKSLKQMKGDVFSLYQSFPPELIIPKLKTYLQQF